MKKINANKKDWLSVFWREEKANSSFSIIFKDQKTGSIEKGIKFYIENTTVRAKRRNVVIRWLSWKWFVLRYGFFNSLIFGSALLAIESGYRLKWIFKKNLLLVKFFHPKR